MQGFLLSGEDVLHPVLWMDGHCAGAGQAGTGRCLSYSPVFLGECRGELCGQAPCGRALPEAGRQGVAELHGAASDIKPLRFLCLADLRSQALLSSLG